MPVRARSGILALCLLSACGVDVPVDEETFATVESELASTATYDASRRAPMCASPASSCTSGTLLVGRATKGPEANAPNTLGSTCADGTSGTFHSDESLDSLTISTLDGTNLAPGKQVRIDAVVWAYSSYASDSLDLYQSLDGSSTWSFVATLRATRAGAHTLSTTFTLPAGGSLRAIRGQFRYGGAAGTCVSGGYNDRDDLLFAVAGSTPTDAGVATDAGTVVDAGTVIDAGTPSDAGVVTNVVLNPGFEGGTLSPWTTTTSQCNQVGACIGYSSAQPRTGTGSVRFNFVTPMAYINGTTNFVSATASQQVTVPLNATTLRAWARTSWPNDFNQSLRVTAKLVTPVAGLPSSISTSANNLTSYTALNVNIAPYAGRAVTIEVSASVSRYMDNLTTWPQMNAYVDDVSIF